MKDRIYQLMKQQGMSQKQFANELCVGEATLSSIFTGRTKPTLNIVNNIHVRFPEVSTDWLMYGRGDMYAGEVENVRPMTLSSDPADEAPASEPSFPSAPSEAVMGANLGVSGMPLVRETIKFIDKPKRQITEIRVFFDDGTYETFSS